MQTINQENIPKTNNKENGLKHGQFKITTKILDNSVVKSVVEHVVNPPSQEELVDGWQLIVPHRNKKSTVHHFSIYLSQLPPYLWKYLHKSWTDNNEQYKPINYGIYQYSVKMSKYDSDIQKLYKLVMKKYSDKNQVTQLYDHLEKQRVKGWIMVRANNVLRA